VVAIELGGVAFNFAVVICIVSTLALPWRRAHGREFSGCLMLVPLIRKVVAMMSTYQGMNVYDPLFPSGAK
jgi:uncharacterized membrane protein YhaH (DUF805 family)